MSSATIPGRSGPAIELVKDLHRRIEEAEIAARGETRAAPAAAGAAIDA